MNVENSNERQVSNGLRALYIIFGIVGIILGVAVLLMPDAGLETLMILLNVGLLFIASGRIVTGVMAKHLSRAFRIVNVVAGISVFVLALMVFLFPIFNLAFLVALFAVALLVYGMSRIMIGGFVDILPGWVRGILVAGGIFTIIMSFIVLLFPGAALISLVFLLSIVLIWNGLDAIVTGVTGSV